MGSIRRISALALVVALSVAGIPLPAHAAGEESPPLTFNGRPLSQFLNRAATGDPLPLANLLGQETGEISGVVVDREGQPLAGRVVHATRVFTRGGNRATQRIGAATTSADGQFSFTGLRASDYLVEVLSGDEVIASRSVTLADGAMQVSGLSVVSVAAAESEPGWWSRQSTPRKVLVGVGVVFGAILVVELLRCLTEPCGG